MSDNNLEVTLGPRVTHYRLRWYTFEQIDTAINDATTAAAEARREWYGMVAGGIDRWVNANLPEDKRGQDEDERADWYATAMSEAYQKWAHLNNKADSLFARWGFQWLEGFDFVDNLVTEEEYLADKEAADAAEDAKIAAEELF